MQILSVRWGQILPQTSLDCHLERISLFCRCLEYIFLQDQWSKVGTEKGFLFVCMPISNEIRIGDL